ncbi:antibiotic biosynthesis monooxygenase family protein [Tropicimonas aquimaris]|uniref:Antibiotic biosynthesis monooxygenase family protein n=1 Tax=Tropicimonas aquimaris TaxID=914152 RepID=A0ABW3ILX2_9RHOB
MYLTMNRFKVKPGCEEEFEQVWKGRESQLPEVPGFVAFHLMKGPEREGYRLYASHTMWESEQAFTDWTKSEAFRKAHAGAGGTRDIYFGPPDLEIFESVQAIGEGL